MLFRLYGLRNDGFSGSDCVRLNGNLTVKNEEEICGNQKLLPDLTTPPHFSEWTETNHKHLSKQPVFAPRFEHGTFQIQSRSVTHPVTFVVVMCGVSTSTLILLTYEFQIKSNYK